MAVCNNFAKQANNKITIQTSTPTGDSYGGQTITWTNTYTVYAIVNSKNVREIFENGQLVSKVIHQMIIRYHSGLSNTLSTAKLRISFDNRLFNVVGIRNLDKTMKSEGLDFQEITAIEGEKA